MLERLKKERDEAEKELNRLLDEQISLGHRLVNEDVDHPLFTKLRELSRRVIAQHEVYGKASAAYNKKEGEDFLANLD